MKKILIFNYHRIGSIEHSNPLHRLHTINKIYFIIHILLFKLFGKIISINDNLSSNINFIITFDDVPITFTKILPFIKKNKIPCCVCISAKNATFNYGIRDKVYIIDKYLNKKQIIDFFVNKEIFFFEDISHFSFYHFTKNFNFDQKIMSSLIDELYLQVPIDKQQILKNDNYLSWNYIKNEIIDDKNNSELFTIVNHGYDHLNYHYLTIGDLKEEIIKSNSLFLQELGFIPEIFAIPFGKFDADLNNKFNLASENINIEKIFWVSNNTKELCNFNMDKNSSCFRVNTPTSIFRFLLLLFSILNENE